MTRRSLIFNIVMKRARSIFPKYSVMVIFIPSRVGNCLLTLSFSSHYRENKLRQGSLEELGGQNIITVSDLGSRQSEGGGEGLGPTNATSNAKHIMPRHWGLCGHQICAFHLWPTETYRSTYCVWFVKYVTSQIVIFFASPLTKSKNQRFSSCITLKI